MFTPRMIERIEPAEARARNCPLRYKVPEEQSLYVAEAARKIEERLHSTSALIPQGSLNKDYIQYCTSAEKGLPISSINST